MLIEDNYLFFGSVDYAAHTICAAATGVTTVSPIYNTTIYTSDKGGLEDEFNAGEYGSADITFTTTQASGSPLTVDSFALLNSTNQYFFQTDDTWEVAVDTTASR